MAKKLVLVGGGHAHLPLLVNLRRFGELGWETTLVSPVTHHYYSGMGPGMLSGYYSPDQVRFHVRKMAEEQGAVFVQDRVHTVDPVAKTLYTGSGTEIPYDLVSFNIGSGVPMSGVVHAGRVYPVKPIEGLLKAREDILTALERGVPSILVIGGGPAGIELTGNILRLVGAHHGRPRVTLVGGDRILPKAPRKAVGIVKASLESRGAVIMENAYLDRIEENTAFLRGGERLEFDIAFMAVGVRPPSVFKDSGFAVSPDGGLRVNEFLQSIDHPEIFGGGDCITFVPKPLEKVGVYAVRQGPVLVRNIMAAAMGSPLEKFTPQDSYMLIFNLGDGTGVFMRKDFVFHSRLAFRLKDWIDRSFMTKFRIVPD